MVTPRAPTAAGLHSHMPLQLGGTGALRDTARVHAPRQVGAARCIARILPASPRGVRRRAARRGSSVAPECSCHFPFRRREGTRLAATCRKSGARTRRAGSLRAAAAAAFAAAVSASGLRAGAATARAAAAYTCCTRRHFPCRRERGKGTALRWLAAAACGSELGAQARVSQLQDLLSMRRLKYRAQMKFQAAFDSF